MWTQVTRVRYAPEESRRLLNEFVFGGSMGPFRPPRGIDRALLTEFIESRLAQESSVNAFRKSLETLRFYECGDVLPRLLQILARISESSEDLQRAAYIAQAAGDVGPSDEAANAAVRFDRVVATHPAAAGYFPLLAAARLALAPAGSDAALTQRLAAEIARASVQQTQNEASMMDFDRLKSAEANELPRLATLSNEKVRTSSAPAAARRSALVSIYLGRATASGPYMETWAARQLRREAFFIAVEPVIDEFRRALAAPPLPGDDDRITAFSEYRAFQAIIYLGGELTVAEHARYQASASEGMSMSFLWDDP